MKTNLKSAIYAALCSAILCGCIEDSATDEPASIAVRFSSTIPKTRAYDNKWEWGDLIGVYMLPAGSADWNDPATGPLAANRKYGHDMERGDAATSDVLFSGVDEQNTLVWPGGDKQVDFIAYYPWREAPDTDDFIYRIDIARQDPQKDIDLMWSNNVKAKSSGSPQLRFSHSLVKLIFNVTDLDGASLENMTATFEGLPTAAAFDLTKGRVEPGSQQDPRSFAGWRSSAGSGREAVGEAIVEAIVIPGTGLDYKVTFGLGGGQQAVFSPSKNGSVDYEPGKRYIYNIRLQPRSGGNTSFGADGELESINGWETPLENGGDHDVDKTGTVGEKWEANPLSAAQEGYTVTTAEGNFNGQNGYTMQASSRLTITKSDYEGGVTRVGVSVKGFSSTGKIVSVKVGGEALATTGGVSSLSFTTTSEAAVYTFSPEGEAPLTGTIEIVIEASGSLSVVGFAVNADN